MKQKDNNEEVGLSFKLKQFVESLESYHEGLYEIYRSKKSQKEKLLNLNNGIKEEEEMLTIQNYQITAKEFDHIKTEISRVELAITTVKNLMTK